jgi:hypothetical protein
MAQARSRVRLGLIAVAVLTLHVAAVWLLLTKSLVLHVRKLTENLELVFLPPPTAQQPLAQPPVPQSERAPQPRRIPRRPQQSESAPQPIPPDIAAPEPEQDNAISPPIDWSAELARQAHDSVAAEANRHYREFDYPRAPLAPEKAPEFAWSRAHTHRIEVGPGGMLVRLSDRCVLVFTPLPFAFCRPGRIPPNDQLFEHMKDPPPALERIVP